MTRRRRTSSRRRRSSIGAVAAFILALLVYLFSRGFPNDAQPGQPEPSGNGSQSRATSADVNLALGNISDAASDPPDPKNYLIKRKQYALSYNRDAGIPNWVSWHLGVADLGDVARGEFAPDTSLPAGWYEVKPSDYTRSGYDRGHMAPSADRTATETDNAAVFLMTNIVPQAPDNNQGPWAQLEDYCRSLVRSGDELYIVSGVNGTQSTFASKHVRVPKNLWKVIVVLPEGDNDLARINDQTEVIAVELPNRQGIRNTPWQHYLTTVDRIEKVTGYDLLANVDQQVQATIEASVATP